jgi:anaerobic selenocysteine-containing dehydrogenase
MFRRQFIQLATLAGAGGLSTIGAIAAAEKKTVTWRIQGFSCITCAVGLDVMLERQKGVVKAESNYKEAKTTIVFHPGLVTEAALQASIAEMGFRVEGQ